MDPAIQIGIAVVATLVVVGFGLFVLRYLKCGGDFAKLKQGETIAQRYMSDAQFKQAVDKALEPPPPPKPSAEPILLLALLQREGRLVDFLLENVDGADNETLGAGVRTIHQTCQKVLREHLVLDPVLKGTEGAAVEVAAGFDPSAIRLTGNVTGQPPFKGTLTHHGWRVAKININKPPEGQDAFVVQPAEVELA